MRHGACHQPHAPRRALQRKKPLLPQQMVGTTATGERVYDPLGVLAKVQAVRQVLAGPLKHFRIRGDSTVLLVEYKTPLAKDGAAHRAIDDEPDFRTDTIRIAIQRRARRTAVVAPVAA